MSIYGALPVSLGIHTVECPEMMFYQYLPIKMANEHARKLERRLRCFMGLIGACQVDFVRTFGVSAITESYIYLTVMGQRRIRQRA